MNILKVQTDPIKREPQVILFCITQKITPMSQLIGMQLSHDKKHMTYEHRDGKHQKLY